MADKGGYIGRNPGDAAVIIARQNYSPTGIQTDFTFNSGYTPGYVDVYINGVRLIDVQDYTASTGNTVGLTSYANSGDIVEVIAYKAFNVGNVSDATSNFTVGGNLTVSGDSIVSGGSTLKDLHVTGVSTLSGASYLDDVTELVSSGIVTVSNTTDSTSTTTGALQVRGGVGVALSMTVGGNLSVGGTVTYEDVTNVDAIGIITARSGIVVSAGSSIGIGTVLGSMPLHAYHATLNTIARFESGDANVNIRFKDSATTNQIGIGAAGNDLVVSAVSGGERLRILSGGNIGIGTDTIPGSSKVHLYDNNTSNYRPLIIDSAATNGSALEYKQLGTNVIRIGSGGNNNLTGSAVTDGLIRTESNLAFAVGNSKKMELTSGGYLHIGGPTENQELSVKGSGTVFVTEGTGGNVSMMMIDVDNSKNLFLQNANGYFNIQTVANSYETKVTVTPSGLVGIGTTNPVGNFDVRDSSRANVIVAKHGLTVKQNSDLSTTYDFIQLGAGGALASYSVATATADTELVHNAYRHSGGNWKYRYADTAMRFRMNSPANTFIWENAASGNADADITFSERLRITATGHMGLGVTPSAWPTNADSTGLQIGTGFAAFGRGSGDEDRGGIAVNYYTDGSSNYYIGNGNANRIYMNDGNIDVQYAATNSSGAGAALTFSNALRIDAYGRVLIGTTTASIASSSEFSEIVLSGRTRGAGITLQDADINCKFQIRTDDNGDGVLMNVTSNDDLVVRTSNQERVRIRGAVREDLDITDTGGINIIQTSNSSNGIGTITIGKAKAGSDGCVQMMSYQAGGDTDQLGWKFKTHSSTAGSAVPDRLFVIDHRGWVGIGTGVPDGDLKIHQAADENVSVVLQRTSCGGDIGSINWKCNATGTLGQINYRGGGGSEGMQFKTHNGSSLKEYFRIHHDGGVRLWDSTSAYEAVDILHTGDAGNGTMALTPVTQPGSGVSSQYIYLKNKGSGSGSTTMNLIVDGALSKGSGSFRIPHPLESLKDTKLLYHSFIEGPQCDNIYRGKVTLSSGTATVNLDTVSNMTEGTFVVLNRDIQCFTSNETGWDAVKGSVSGNILTITSQNNSSTDIISWMVIGERQDPNIKESPLTDDNGHLIVEGDKGGS